MQITKWWSERRALAVGLIALTAGVATACQRDARAAVSAKQVELAGRVEKMLERSPHVETRRIEVRVTPRGVAILEGEVDTLLAEQDALSLARVTPGIQGVEDHIEIDTQVRDDSVLTSRLRRALLVDPAMQRVDAMVLRGVALLEGRVDDPEHAKEARRIAASVRGIRRVLERIEARPRPMRATLLSDHAPEAELM